MNWLAHIFLSEQQVEYQLGNLMADFVKGNVWQDASSEFRQGLKMHTLVDVFTDRHPMFLTSKSRLGNKGHLKGVVVDLTYDLLLTKHWNAFSNIELNSFLNNFYNNAQSVISYFPEAEKSFITKIIRSDHLRHYQTLEDLELTFKRVDTRLSQRILAKESTLDYLPLVTQNLSLIEQDFLAFFPDLLNHVRSQSNKHNLAHWR